MLHPRQLSGCLQVHEALHRLVCSSYEHLDSMASAVQLTAAFADPLEFACACEKVLRGYVNSAMHHSFQGHVSQLKRLRQAFSWSQGC